MCHIVVLVLSLMFDCFGFGNEKFWNKKSRMAKCKILNNEKYWDDVCSSIFLYLKESVRRRDENSVWGPFVMTSNAKIYRETELEKIPDNAHLVKIDSTVSGSDTCRTNARQLVNCRRSPTSNETSEVVRSDINILNEETCIKIPTFFDELPRSTETNRKKRTVSGSEKMENTRKTQAIGSERKSDVFVSNEFQNWCQKRHKDFEDHKSKDFEDRKWKDLTSHSATNSLDGLRVDNSVQYNICSNAELKKINSCQMAQSPAKEYSLMESKSDKLKAMDTYVSSKKKNSGVKTITKATRENKNSSHAVEEKSLVCIKLTDEEGDRSCEFVVELADILRTKRKFPKLSKVMPNVDSDESVKIKFSFDAVKVIFGYLFNQRYKFDATPSSLIGVEVLAAAQFWEMGLFFEKFQRNFLQKAFTLSNIAKIFSHASQYGLKEVCDACKTFNPNEIDLDYPTDEQKSCFLTISTFVEPLECCIPFNPVELTIKNTFERRIKNQVTFKVISGCYTITGFQLQLNDNFIQKMSDNKRRLKIDYNIKNVNDHRALSNQRAEKPLRPVNIVYFNKALVVSTGQSGIINVEMDVQPYLCSALNESEMKIRKSVGEFQLSMLSDFTLNASNKKVFIIGKLFYHEKGSKGSKK